MQARFLCFALLVAGSVAAADDTPPPMTDEAPAIAAGRAAPVRCDDCGIIQSIRTIEHQRADRRRIPNYMASEQYLDTRRYSEPTVGPIVGMTFGPGQETRSFVGAAGANTMRQSLLEISYEITVRFDDGRHALIEQDDARGMRIGDRVRMVDKRLRLAPHDAQ